MSRLEQKIEGFIRKYYTNELLRGLIFFVAIGVSYFLITLVIEYFLWLNPAGRAVLFWSFVAVETLLFVRFICLPLARLFKLTKGIDINQASVMIGDHFPEVSDKLINTLQLQSNANSDLALASIKQRSKELEPIPFSLAVNYKKNGKYLKWLLIPAIIFLIVNFSTDSTAFGNSYDRVVNYKTAYEPPAPFSFFVVTDSLVALEGQKFTIEVNTEGSQIPDGAQIHFGESQFFMKKNSTGRFTYTIERLENDLDFYFTANDVTSRPYTLKVIKTPFVSSFLMHLNYPAHTGKLNETVENYGNITVPEGTKISWELEALETSNIEWISRDTTLAFTKENIGFTLSRNVYKNTPYSITTSNESLQRYESLNYEVRTIADAFPEIEIEMKKDTVDGLQNYHYGKVSDDYGLRSLKLVYFPLNDKQNTVSENIDITKSTVYNFVNAFPGNLPLQEGVSYSYYFLVADNDAIHGFKTSRSETFNYKKLSQDELQQQQLQQQQKSISGLDQSVKKFDKQSLELDKLKDLQKEKSDLNYNDRQRLKSFLERQKQQDKMMREFSQNLRKNLEDFNKQPDQKDITNDMLQERLIENEDVLKQREELLEELKELQDKMNKEELSEKLDELSKQNSNSKRSLKQLVELTKRFYLQKKIERIGKDMKDLGQKQEDLANDKEKNSSEEQKKINEEFKKLEKELSELKKESEDLSAPMEIPEDVPLQESIKEDQREAEEMLEDSEQQNSSQQQQDAEKKQKQAGAKMKKLSSQMSAQMLQSSGEKLQEDSNMLRQILDNLLEFSFQEEKLMDKFKTMDNRNPKYSSHLIQQGELKENFEHIDDSLFALSLRQPDIEEIINSQLTNVDFYINKAIEDLSENRVGPGVGRQQYVVTGANTLAELLSDVLDNMNNQMMQMGKSGSGKPMPGQSGQGQGQQLSDIIMSQQEINDKLGKGAQGEKESDENDSGKGKGDKDGGDSPGNKPGQQGKNGQGSSGNSGDGISEQQMEELFEIYKQQQEIRKQLEDYIEDNDLREEAGNLLQEMEQAENDLLENGLNSESRNRLNNIQHQLMKLKDAENEQGEDNNRTARTNYNVYEDEPVDFTPQAAEYFNNKEILNRDNLPLQSNFKLKVQQYFNKKDD